MHSRTDYRAAAAETAASPPTATPAAAVSAGHAPAVRRALAVLLAGAACLSCATGSREVADTSAAAAPALVAEAPAPAVHEPLRLVPGDGIQVRFFYYPELNASVIVREDGRVSLDLVDDVQVEGLTPTELDAVLSRRYAPHLRYPTLTVVVTEGPRHVYVGGEVRQPGALTLNRRMTVVQAIYAAGSLSDKGDAHRIVLLREAGPGLRTYQVIDLDLVLQAKAEDLALKPFDVVFVPRTSIANLNLWVEQYIDKLLPFGRSVSYNYTEVLR